MNYDQTLDYLYNTLPMFSRMGSAAIKKDLTNIQILCKQLHSPQLQFKSIHVGGTNGKGSVSHMLAAVLQTAGYKVGLYTSPHLKDFRERIKLNGEMMPHSFVVQFVDKLKPLIEEIKPSFFEITVAMAFDYFTEQKVDVAIIEVGLGGRLGSTNIIQPELAVITNIGWDHMNMLGNTLEMIAGEKGGIIKQDTPVVIGEKNSDTAGIFKTIAGEKNAPIYFAEDYFSIVNYQIGKDELVAEVKKYGADKKIYKLDLPGIYQLKNIITVLQTIDVLKAKGFDINETKAQEALAATKKLTGLFGRWDVVQQKPTVVLEVAHNEDGVLQMLAHTKRVQYRQLHIIIGMVKDKEIEKILQLLPADAHYYFTQAHIPRALEATTLQEKASYFNLHGNAYADVNLALGEAISRASPEDLIIVCGSIFLVAEVNLQRG